MYKETADRLTNLFNTQIEELQTHNKKMLAAQRRSFIQIALWCTVAAAGFGYAYGYYSADKRSVEVEKQTAVAENKRVAAGSVPH